MAASRDHLDDHLELSAAQEILRRAVRLDRGDPAVDGLSRQALEAAASEIGVHPTAMAMALAEAATGVHGRRRRLEGVVGPRAVVAVRVCAVPADDAVHLARTLLERGHLLRVSGSGSLVVGHRRRDPAAKAVRTLRSMRGTAALSKVQEVRAGVGSLADGTAAVCVHADVSDRRTGAVITGSIFGALGVLGIGGRCRRSRPVGAAAGAGRRSAPGWHSPARRTRTPSAGSLWPWTRPRTPWPGAWSRHHRWRRSVCAGRAPLRRGSAGPALRNGRIASVPVRRSRRTRCPAALP